MKIITSLCLLPLLLMIIYSCTPEGNEYPKKYVYTSYSIKSAEMYAKESDTSFEIVDGRDEFIEGIVDTVKLTLDSFVIGQFNFITSFTFVDEELIRLEGIMEPGIEFDTIVPYYIRNSFIYLGPQDSTSFVVGYKDSEELIEQYYITTIIKRSVNNPIGFHGAPNFDLLEDLTVNEYILNLNEEGRITVGDSVIAVVHPFNYVLE